MSFGVRAEFFNLSNQNLSAGSTAAPTNRFNGVLTRGFGFLNDNGLASNSVNSSLPAPRTGQIVARVKF